MTDRLVEQAFEHERRVPALRTDHQSGHPGQAGLERHDHQVAHDADVLSARNVRLGRLVEGNFGEPALQSIELVHLLLDGSDGIEVLGKLAPVGVPQLAPQGAGILQDEIRDVAELPDLLRAEQPAVGLAGTADRGCDMARSVPGDVVEVDGLQIVPVAVAAQFQGAERRPVPDPVRDDVVERAVQRPGGSGDRERCGAAEKTRGALRMHVGADLECPVQTRDQGHLALQAIQRLEGGREIDRMGADGGLRLDDRAQVPVERRKSGVALAGKETAANHPDRHIEESQAQGRAPLGPGGRRRHALKPGQPEHGASRAAKKRPPGGDPHSVSPLAAAACPACSDCTSAGTDR